MKEDFCVEHYPLYTMVRGQIHNGVKCLQNTINNVTTEKSHNLVAHTLTNISCEFFSLTSIFVFLITSYYLSLDLDFSF